MNVVLFHNAAHVEAIDIPEGAEITASTGYMTEEGPEVEYSVVERVPKKQASEKKDDEGKWPDLAALGNSTWLDDDAGFREATLRIDLDSIKVHVVRRVQFECDEHEVRRHRSEKVDYKF